MIDLPWNKNLKKEQIVQLFTSLRCTEVKEHYPGSALWKAPTGNTFSVSYADCDAKQLEIIVAQIEKWVEEARTKRD